MKITEEVLSVLKQATIDGNLLKLNGQLDRKLYLETNKVLESLGGSWNKKMKGHLFQEDPQKLIEKSVDSGNYVDAKKEFQFFETPETLAKQMIDWAEISQEHRVLEPSAGNGNILKFIPWSADYCEIQQNLSDSLQMKYKNCSFKSANFLEYNPGPIYDRIVANPPFTKKQEIEHVSHMLDCCRSGGRIVSIMSRGITFRNDSKTKDFMEMIEKHSFSIHENPDGIFKDSGTMVSTITIIINK